MNNSPTREDGSDSAQLDEDDFETLLENEEDLENQVANANVFKIEEIAKMMMRKR